MNKIVSIPLINSDLYLLIPTEKRTMSPRKTIHFAVDDDNFSLRNNTVTPGISAKISSGQHFK